MIDHLHRVINSGKDLWEAGKISQVTESFNDSRVSRQKFQSSEKVDQQLMLGNVVNTAAGLHDCLCNKTTDLGQKNKVLV